ncbi:intraflagellar transport protein 20 homolog [Sycon ciliatum]|uniref:intraflagellar transport protein 20 homolog n=1 Tax=Sycon ciliatum TaxID=27933 RepID=UPI0031F6FCF6|eukprot:scpid92809/ scgid30950/ Intraflagellar transport protein 20 homolog
MADDEVQAPANLHFDDLNKLRVVSSEVSEETAALRDECRDFVSKFEAYQNLVGNFTGLMGNLSKEVEAHKMKAIGARNLLKTVRKQRETQQQQLREKIAELSIQLERYRIEAEQLQQHEEEQVDFVAQFASSKGV